MLQKSCSAIPHRLGKASEPIVDLPIIYTLVLSKLVGSVHLGIYPQVSALPPAYCCYYASRSSLSYIFVIGLFCLVLVFIVVMTLFDDSFLLCWLSMFVNGFFGILFGGTCCVWLLPSSILWSLTQKDKTRHITTQSTPL